MPLHDEYKPCFFGNTINDTNHVEIFKDCAYKAPVKVKYRKTPEKQK